MKSVVIGGGLVGSVLAIILKKQGHEVSLFEKRSDFTTDSETSGRSINLILTAKGVKALKDLDLYEKVKTLTVPVYGRTMHGMNSEIAYQPYGKDDSEYNLSVPRSKLNQTLINQAKSLGVKTYFDQELQNIDFEKQKVSFLEEMHSYDLLFGCDGAGSKTRKVLIDHLDGSSRVEWLNSNYKELLMPTKNGTYPIDKRSLHIWPRGSEFLMALPNQDGSFTMTLYMDPKKYDKVNTSFEIQTLFEKLYPDSIEHMPDYIKDYQQNPVGKLGTVYCDQWSNEKNVFLVGDSAHSIVPFFGQGMNLGLNDCSLLMKLISGKDDLRSFQSIQKPNADAIAQMALENFIEMQDSVGNKDFLKRKALEHKIENTLPAIYRSRYALVTYTLVDYHHCQQIGLIQNAIVDKLITQEWNLNKCRALIEEKLVPYYEKYNIDLSTFTY